MARLRHAGRKPKDPDGTISLVIRGFPTSLGARLWALLEDPLGRRSGQKRDELVTGLIEAWVSAQEAQRQEPPQ